MTAINNNSTICITSCYGKRQILETVKSIRSSEDGQLFRIIIIADSVPVPSDVKKQLKNFSVELIENPYKSSAFAKQKQIIERCQDEILILTQDDVLFPPRTLTEVIKTFTRNPEVTFVGVKNEPLKPENLFESGVNTGTNLLNRIAGYWNKGNNYLACLGRLMAFRTAWLKELEVESESVSLDAYLYFENKKSGGEYKCLWQAPLYFRNPQNIQEHIRKSSRFQHSRLEMASYHRFDKLEKEYAVPTRAVIRAGIEELVKNPVGLLAYIWIFSFTRLFAIRPELCLFANWQVDLSTKKISFKPISLPEK